MLGNSLVRGIKAGSIAGVVYGLFVRTVASPLFEYIAGSNQPGDSHAAASAAGHSHAASEHAHAVSEATTVAVSIGGSVLWGILLGACFGVAYYLFEPAIPGTRSGGPILLAGAGFLIVSVVPWTVLPPATPGMERTLAIEASIAVYIGLMALGAALCAGSFQLYRRTAEYGPSRAAVLAVLPIAAVLVALSVASPQVVESGDVPGTLVTAYRGVVVTGQFITWLLTAVCFAWFRRRQRDDTSLADGRGLSIP